MIDSHVYKIGMEGPGDVSGLEELIDKGEVSPEDIAAIIAKTEGNGLVNDFSRGQADLACKILLSKKMNISLEEVGQRVSLVMSGGTEGVISPHFSVFIKREAEGSSKKGKRLAIGISHTREFKPEEIGRMPMVKEVADRVKEAMEEAGIKDPKDVHFVQIKCPLLTSSKIKDARDRGETVATDDTLKSMGYSRAASALGVALTLGEVSEEDISDESIYVDRSLYSEVASTSAGVELDLCEIVVLGNSPESISDLRIGHSVMKDGIDAEAVRAALKDAGMEFDCQPSKEQASRIVNVFAKCGAPPSGEVRDRRHTMLTDSMLPSTRHARAVVGAVIGSVTGDPMVYVSGGSEHQGPPGGGPIAAIIRVD
ncbi:ring-opening amidohydrolase [Candidatus Bathyarchaeota archaeon]|nr:ring-opening amidohydrolase [Candidatus Bathyarchaeota archaeon]